MLALANQLPLPEGQQSAVKDGAQPTPTREAVLAQLRSMLWRGALAQTA
jgi:hypothetical protein